MRPQGSPAELERRRLRAIDLLQHDVPVHVVAERLAVALAPLPERHRRARRRRPEPLRQRSVWTHPYGRRRPVARRGASPSHRSAEPSASVDALPLVLAAEADPPAPPGPASTGTLTAVSTAIEWARMLPCGGAADYLPCGTKGISERCTALVSTRRSPAPAAPPRARVS
jgi:hypothetical protein